jgi:hypothetical protein
MATKDVNRINKDNSARKQPNVLWNAKVQADEMYQQFLL